MQAKSTPRSVVVLTGAGISAESGLKTFRDNNGLWENHPVEDVATPQAFAANPTLVHRFYNLRRAQLVNKAKPNTAHKVLADFEMSFRGDYTLITQNVDDLHERAGSKNVLHMHGELLKIRCAESGEIYSHQQDLDQNMSCPCCNKSGQLRPHIVWFGEIPLYMNDIESVLAQCDLFVSIGTSGNVYPAAGFQQLAKHYGAHTVELNLEPSMAASHFHEQHYGLASELVPEFFQTVLGNPL
ncbi:Sir2 family NAD+-dependent deacetylase [Halioxenophilus aromaticivorans]|uniref:NAD-dependent protein deacylase n=1 Tax=Halioxenophilus aromaticivorans TaxID=1306992 RepID=A0AAV3U5N5_9ALTE